MSSIVSVYAAPRVAEGYICYLCHVMLAVAGDHCLMVLHVLVYCVGSRM